MFSVQCEEAPSPLARADDSRALSVLTRARRLLCCVRWGEVLLLQVTPLAGVVLTMGPPTWSKFMAALVMFVADVLLLAHIWTMNDWADVDADASNPRRSRATFVKRGVSRAAMGRLSVVLALLAFLVFACLSLRMLSIALLIAAIGWLYSGKPVYGKGRCVISSVLHFLGGCLHFLLGCSLFASPDHTLCALSVLFGLVFTAGHAIQEVEDHDADRRNGIRTNAVVFGRPWQFSVGCVLFAAAYLHLALLAYHEVIPACLGWVALVAAFVQCCLTLEVYRQLRDGAAVRRYRQAYRCLFVIFGLILGLGVL